MAGDWIKMRTDLQTHPKVVRMMSALKADRLRVIGGLHAVWSLFDAHSVDGTLDGYTPDALDSLIGWPGFAKAMMAINWLEQTGESLATPRFDEHNGQSAKRRCQETERKRAAREQEKLSADDADEKRTREEKRREELTNPNGLDVASDAADHCPHQKIIALYHEVLPMCPRVRDWTPARATQLRARWNEEKNRQSLDYWKRFFEYVKTCDFLVGKAGKEPFFADLEWLTKSSNFTKVREAKYENRSGQ